MKALWVIIAIIAASFIAAPFAKVPAGSVSVCEGHEPVVRQISSNDYASGGFTGQAWCADGIHEYWTNGTRTEPRATDTLRYTLIWCAIVAAIIVAPRVLKHVSPSAIRRDANKSRMVPMTGGDDDENRRRARLLGEEER